MIFAKFPIATAGLIGTITLAIGAIISSGILLAVGAIVVIGYAWYSFDTPTTSTQDTQSIDPEVVREKTMQWSDSYDQSTRQQLTPDPVHRETQSASNQQSTTRTSDGDDSEPGDSRGSSPMSLDSPELQYRWETETDVSFDDVGGFTDVKQELRRDVIKPLTTHREQAKQLDISPSNIIFHGPPGTGKTYLAQALASELAFPFVELSGSDVQSKWINESAQKVRTLFDEARQVAAEEGGAVVFLDELDSVLKRRGNQTAHEEDNKVVNEFLNHLETASDHNIIFIGATNRLESLDEAGIRSGRIDKKAHIGLPDQRARKEILRVQLADRPNSLSEDHLEQIAGWTQGMSAAELAQIIDDAARSCLDRGSGQITWLDIRQVISP